MSERTVLLIDDELAIATALTIRLRAAGFRVLTAGGGIPGLEAAAEHRPDVILLDIRMPDLDGFEVCRRIKSDTDLAEIPVIFLSANIQSDAKQTAINVGGAAFLSKPFEPKEVINTILAVAHPVTGATHGTPARAADQQSLPGVVENQP